MPNLIPHFIGVEYAVKRLAGQFEAASMFIDLAGFTGFTAALMQHGKAGAEVLTQSLNQILSTPVQMIYQHDGFITNFAGDGFTALFPKADGPSNAAAAAAAIVNFVKEKGLIQTRYGNFRLDARIGLGYGMTTWGILGKERRLTYFFSGRSVATCVKAEAYADKGQILIAPELAVRLPGGTFETRAVKGGYSELLPFSSAKAGKTVKLPDVPVDLLERFGLKSVLELESLAEFRSAATVFIGLGRPRKRDEVDAFVSYVLELTADFGGYFNKLEFADKGGVILVVFGAPTGYENNLERAADFLLALRKYPTIIQWRAGLTAGTVYAGRVGGIERSEYTVIGDVVNMASRLMSRAKPGEVWTRQKEVEALSTLNYQFTNIGLRRFKGQDRLITVFNLADKRGYIQRDYKLPLVERGDELTQLTQAISPIFAGQFGGMVYIYGKWGMGKTRLAAELHHQLADRTSWFVCKASQSPPQQSLNLFRLFLQDYFEQSNILINSNIDHFQTKLNELVHFLKTHHLADLHNRLERAGAFLASFIGLPSALVEQLTEKQRFEGTLSAFRTLILAESQRQPVVLQIEDSQWLDADSQTLLEQLTYDVDAYPFVIILTSRYGEDGELPLVKVEAEVPSMQIELKGMSEAGIARLTASILGGAVGDEMIAYLKQRTDGNPLIIEATVRHLHARNALIGGEVWRAKTLEMRIVPEDIRDVLTAQLDRLDTRVRFVVQQAAILGEEFQIDVLEAMRETDTDVIEKVKRAETQEIWQVSAANRYSFRHGSLRDAAYEMQMPAELVQGHRRAAQAIEQVYGHDLSQRYVELAYHYRQAEDKEQERHYAILASYYSVEQYANQQALDFLSRALELTPETDYAKWFELLMVREKVYDRLGWRREQLADLNHLKRLVEQFNDPVKSAQAALRRATYAEIESDFPRLTQEAQQAIDLAQVYHAIEEEVMGHIVLGKYFLQKTDFVAAQSHFQRGLELAQKRELTRLQPECLRGLGGMAISTSDSFDEAQRYFDMALAISRENGDFQNEVQTLSMVGLIGFRKGRLSEAKQAFQEALDGFTKMGDLRNQTRMLMNLGTVMAVMGDRRSAIDYFERGLPILREMNDRRAEAMLHQNIGSVEQFLGRFRQSESHTQKALAIFKRLGDKQGEAQTSVNWGLLCRSEGRYDDAQAHYNHALSLFRETDDQRGQTDVGYSMGFIAADMGDYETAQIAYEKALNEYRISGDQEAESDVNMCMALLFTYMGDYTTAIQHGETALKLAMEIPSDSSQAYAHTALGHALFASGEPERAKEHYQTAVELRQKLGERHLEAEARAGLANVALAKGERFQMKAQIEAIWSQWKKADNFDGTTEPISVYLTCYQVLQALGDHRADEILEAGWKMLHERLKTVRSDRLRYSYQAHSAANRAFILAYQQATK
jgi:class 3 adenylate cyclase/tetratricopeptide (TPR) repeat protein